MKQSEYKQKGLQIEALFVCIINQKIIADNLRSNTWRQFH